MKSFLKSKTLWFNIIAAVLLGIVGITGGVEPELEVGIIATANIILRIITKEPLEMYVPGRKTPLEI